MAMNIGTGLDQVNWTSIKRAASAHTKLDEDGGPGTVNPPPGLLDEGGGPGTVNPPPTSLDEDSGPGTVNPPPLTYSPIGMGVYKHTQQSLDLSA